MNPSRAHAVSVLVALLGAGCLSGDAPGRPNPEGPVQPGVDVEALPFGCDAARPAVSYRNGNASASEVAFFPCLLQTTFGSVEPNIAIRSDGVVVMAPGFIRKPFGPLLLPPDMGILRNLDEGASWEMRIPNLAGQQAHPQTNDPYMYMDPATNRIWFENLQGANCSQIAWTDDAGDTWEHSVTGCTQTDHVSLFAGPPVTSSTMGYPNVVYRCGIHLVLATYSGVSNACQKSIDGGRVWAQTGEPAFLTELSGGAISPRAGPCAAGLGHGVVDGNGTVYIPKAHCGNPWLAMSHDEGLTWERVQVSDMGVSTQITWFGSCPPCEHVGPSESHDAAVGVDRNGRTYYAWVSNDRLPYLTTSSDAGTTWSTPVRITDAPINEAWNVELAVGAPGRVAFVVVGTENGPGPPFEGTYDSTPWNGYIIVSLDADVAEPTFHRSTINQPDDPLVRGSCWAVCGDMRDFIDIRIAPDGTPWAPFVDNCFETCEEQGLVLAGRVAGVSLWDDADSNGPYPGP